jgi:cell division protease FtsH
MSNFDKIIGYETIKGELMQICDILKNQETYKELGAKLPQGMLLNGEPGLGKTLMAKALIAESGLKAYTVRRNKGNNDFVGEITKVFEQAKKNAPSIVFLDDMDKFANEDSYHRDAEEYVAVQAGIDDVKDCGVFVIATVNEDHKLPSSLIRSGRFDRRINVKRPFERDAVKIIEYYVSDKKLADDVNMDDLSKMISYSSCAELETILNDAAINAAYARKDNIEMKDLVGSVLRMQYHAPDNFTKTSAKDNKLTALHEAGHLVACEVLNPGSVGLASIRTSGRGATGGFIHRCKNLNEWSDDVIISLAGKAAVEMFYSDSCADGCRSDISRAAEKIRDYISYDGTCGFGIIDVSDHCADLSESIISRSEAVTQAMLERYMMKTRSILIHNVKFLEKAAKALEEKETLLYSDIQKLKKQCKPKKKAS